MKIQSEKVENSVVPVPNPDPEVREAKPRKSRRPLTAEYKLRIVQEADRCRGNPGAISALLRREGLYSSAVNGWREQRENGALSRLSQKRGRKPKYSPLELQNQRLLKEQALLNEKLRQANLIIEAQKKIAEILGNPIQPGNGPTS